MDILDAVEVRVLGCLIEKEATVPDIYPLTVNSLRSACNQSTSRDPIVAYDDATIEAALGSLRASGLTRTVHSKSNRATKYRHVADEVYSLEPPEMAVVCVLLLRGPQTVGELKGRTNRQYEFGSTEEVTAVLESLAARQTPLVEQLERQPGQKDSRWIHLLGEVAGGDGAAPPSATPLVSVPTLRVARPCADVDLMREQYAAGLNLEVMCEWRNHDGYDGVVLGVPNGPYHFEFVRVDGQPDPAPLRQEHLIVIYYDDQQAWQNACKRMLAAEFEPVTNPNPYWEQHGRTYLDLEGSHVVIATTVGQG